MAQPKASISKPKGSKAAERAVVHAFETLANQPVSVAGLSDSERNAIVISAITDLDGEDIILSRYGDMVWELWPYIKAGNINRKKKQIDWAAIPENYRDACKAALFRWWKVGNPGVKAPGAVSLQRAIHTCRVICRYFATRGLPNLAHVQSLHISNFMHIQKSAQFAKGTLMHRFSALELLYRFRDQHPESLQSEPFPESSAAEAAGVVGPGKKDARASGKTPLIPAAVAQKLYLHAEKILQNADALLDERDAGLRSATLDPEITVIRNSCFYLLGVLTGMRSSELSSIEVGAARTELRNGHTFHWVTALETKTGKGRVDYLMPSIGHVILRIMERWSKPFRAKLADSLAAWESDSEARTSRLQDIASARHNQNKLFLGHGNGNVGLVSGCRWLAICRQFAREAGVDWPLAPHQMRRLYAFTFVRHKLGNILFLKEQFKHSSINMSQLYAANPWQDAALYEEIMAEMLSHKVATVTQWLQSDELLAGGGGKEIMTLRAHDFPNRAAMIAETSNKLTIRSTGHSWCLAQDEGCGGSGIYERGRCGSCSRGVIDQQFVPVWQEAYRHHRELLEDVKTLGPGAQKRVERDLNQAERILKDLGVQVGGDEDASSAA